MHFTHPRLLAKALLLPFAGTLALCGVAQAQDDLLDSGVSIPKEVVARIAAARAARAAEGPINEQVDHQPPKLKSIRVFGSVDTAKPNQTITAEFDISDDLSGIAYYLVRLRSPSGLQHIERIKIPAFPLRPVTSSLTVGEPFSWPDFTIFTEPGTWVADYFYVEDAAHNIRQYSQSQLALLGDTSFVVTNIHGYDSTAPTLSTGTITTPVVRKSVPPRGTPAGTPPYVEAQLNLTDSGNGLVSGSYKATVHFCTANCNSEFTMQGEVNLAGQPSNKMNVGVQLAANQAVGTYEIDEIQVFDIAGNELDLKNNTNFSNYFPAGTTVVVQN